MACSPLVLAASGYVGDQDPGTLSGSSGHGVSGGARDRQEEQGVARLESISAVLGAALAGNCSPDDPRSLELRGGQYLVSNDAHSKSRPVKYWSIPLVPEKSPITARMNELYLVEQFSSI